ncbi:MAG: hypothetical protein SGI98_04410 [Verrucomicrobiota bacterium]|nr:hypothetical protein [Verrucomicrobiota bacterium]
MFYALKENKIEMHGYRFKHILLHIQPLNERSIRGEYPGQDRRHSQTLDQCFSRPD